ncbi:DUF5810 domain-containing protein [Natronosalvus halobius]|uniref:DUF5810 domain-containing protein n=1 Tax=Natronosalvus halobius TaxID=2953746 RepID=UPI00209F435D|nr:DUF5810 domain-containing protein [Natronosalvus halobius]USZ70904.1 DUF5810 domain-containing protein [Natronosalvus halobius]
MGYVCPICEAGVTDGRQLADHLAVTASLGRTAHLEWLEEHVPDWGSRTRGELASAATPHALEVELPVSEDAPEGPRVQSGRKANARNQKDPGGPSDPRLEDAIARQAQKPGRGDVTAETEDVLEEAKALTARMEGEGAPESRVKSRAEDGPGDETGNETGNENA